LIGGKSTRFGSDKGLFNFRGKALISYLIETLIRFNKDIFLVANSKYQVHDYISNIDFRNILGFIIDEDNLISDQESNSPLIGLCSAFKELKELEYEKVFVLPCDTPLVKFEVLDYIINQCKKFDCCVPKWQDNLLEPLLAIYPIKKAYETSHRNIKQNQYKLTKIIGRNWKTNYISIEHDIKRIDPNLLSFKNINKREEIKILESNLNRNQ